MGVKSPKHGCCLGSSVPTVVLQQVHEAVTRLHAAGNTPEAGQ